MYKIESNSTDHSILLEVQVWTMLVTFSTNTGTANRNYLANSSRNIITTLYEQAKPMSYGVRVSVIQ